VNELVQIHDVELDQVAADHLVEWQLKEPCSGVTADRYDLKVAGWALVDPPPARIDAYAEGRLLRSIAVNVPRPEVVRHHPDFREGHPCGFHARVSLLGLPLDFELDLELVLASGEMLRIGRVRGSRAPVRALRPPLLNPLLLTSMGRTGTTWLMRLLGQHAAIVADPHYPHELRVARYWLHVLGVLAAPANPAQSADQDTFQRSVWSVGHNPFYSGALSEDRLTGRWFGHEHVERLAAACRESIDSLYGLLAETLGKPQARYFAEKHLPDHLPGLAWDLYPEAKELFLVRDFRDMVASMLAFNARRGFASFGRERVSSDGEFVRGLARDAGRLAAAWRSRGERALLVRYEDVVCNPVDEIRRICAYLDVDASAEAAGDMVAGAAASSEELEAHRTTPDQASSIGRWRDDLAPHVAAACEEALGETMATFGYPAEAVA
jgi:Sulfotransferase family